MKSSTIATDELRAALAALDLGLDGFTILLTRGEGHYAISFTRSVWLEEVATVGYDMAFVRDGWEPDQTHNHKQTEAYAALIALTDALGMPRLAFGRRMCSRVEAAYLLAWETKRRLTGQGDAHG